MPASAVAFSPLSGSCLLSAGPYTSAELVLSAGYVHNHVATCETVVARLVCVQSGQRRAGTVDRKLNNRNVKVKTDVATARPPSGSAPGSRPTNAVSTTDNRGSMASAPSAGTARPPMHLSSSASVRHCYPQHTHPSMRQSEIRAPVVLQPAWAQPSWTCSRRGGGSRAWRACVRPCCVRKVCGSNRTVLPPDKPRPSVLPPACRLLKASSSCEARFPAPPERIIKRKIVQSPKRVTRPVAIPGHARAALRSPGWAERESGERD